MSTALINKLVCFLPQIVKQQKSDSTPYTIRNFQRYNSLARQAMKGTGVVVWDSTIPLSLNYVRKCHTHPEDTPVTFWWKCEDKTHVGYILVEQFADMVLNTLCNTYLGLGDDYCT